MSTTSPSPEPPTPSPSLPPSARDYLAYERIVIESASTRLVAAELKISQTRVRQIVRRVADWLPSNLPQHSEARDAAQLRLAQYIAADRLQHYLAEVSRDWQQTHESKYMTAILRILTAQSKLPAHPGTLAALAADALENVVLSGHRREAVVGEGQEAEDALQSQAVAPTTTSTNPPPSSFSIYPSEFPSPPPSEDCSPPPKPTRLPTSKSTAAPLPTPESTTTSAASASTNNSARRAFLAPAHSPERNDDPTITELKITPQKLALQTSPPSSRRDRRRLKRLLAK